MGKIGYGYGSEWHLLRYLGRHRDALGERILKAVQGDSVTWLDSPSQTKAPFDAEWKGVDFLPKGHPALKEWLTFWPQSGNVPNWDAVGVVTRSGSQEWLLVEAKANLQELRSSCAAKLNGGLGQIQATLASIKSDLKVQNQSDWLKGYYQYCNRVAVLHFLQSRKIPARLVCIYFTGDQSGPRRTCPANAAGWATALQGLDNHVGLPAGHSLAERIHTLFLPVAS